MDAGNQPKGSDDLEGEGFEEQQESIDDLTLGHLENDENDVPPLTYQPPDADEPNPDEQNSNVIVPDVCVPL